MRRFVVFSFLLAIWNFAVLAQRPFTLLDTVHIDEVVTYGELKKYQSGAKIESISSDQFNRNQDGNLDQLLSRTLPIAFKSHAGGLSTIRIRGSAPDHTSINFGGININSLTLGHSNVSNIPVYLFDNLGVQFGSASSVNGSGSIGGAIHLGIQNNWTDGFKAEARIASGSFGEQLYGTKLFVGNGRFEAVTRFYFYSKTNDFPFLNPNYRDFENQIFEIKDVQKNSNIENYGILQELNYRFSSKEYFTFRAWYENNWHRIQQNMQSNLNNPGLKEDHFDKNLRIWSSYKNKRNRLNYEINGGYVSDHSVHNQNNRDSIQTKRYITEIALEHKLTEKASYKVGSKAMRIQPNVYAYSKQLKNEDRLDFYASYFHQINKKLTTTLNLRKGFVSGFKVPFTPSLGFNYLIFSKEKSVLKINGNIARSYRVPTFNDRFWVPGGNPNLKPEKGINYEVGGKWSICDGETSGNIKLNAFLMNINNWILWKNGGAFWYAENVQNVQSKGIEIMTDLDYNLGMIDVLSGINYTFTSAKRVKSISSTNAINRQLEYVPVHTGNIFSTFEYEKITCNINGTFTGEQFTDEEVKNVLNPYFLLDISSSYQIIENQKHELKILGSVNNILNSNYQASWGYAMPGINYRLSIIYKFK